MNSLNSIKSYYRSSREHYFFKKGKKLLVRNAPLGMKTLTSMVKEGASRITQFVSRIASQIMGKERELDRHKLLKGKGPISSSQFAWHLNLALLRSAHEKTKDPVLREKINFLATNYLNKSAPIYIKTMRFLNSKVSSIFQVGGFTKYQYHRMAFRQNMKLGADFNKNFALYKKSPLILTDAEDFSHLFPLSFTVINDMGKGGCALKQISGAVVDHLKRNLENPFKHPIGASFLFDLSTTLSASIETEGFKGKEEIFKAELKQTKQKINQIIDLAISELEESHPELCQTRRRKRRLKQFIQNNCTCIAHVKKGNKAGIKVLPVFADLSGKRILKTHTALLDFIDYTGVYIGAMNLRRQVLDSFSVRKDISYAPKGLNALYFKNKSDLTELALFKRLKEKLSSKELQQNKPHLVILGKATLQILDGLFREMRDDQWKSLNQDPATREIIQFSLYKIKEHLANAELWMHDYKKYAQEMEFVHAEIATLLELAPIFLEEDFSQIYLDQLKEVPAGLKEYIQAGLGKTAVNTFAGINAAIASKISKPTHLHGTGFYFEQAAFLRNDQLFEKALNDPKIKKVDLYACQFSPNIEILADHTHYSLSKIANDVQRLLNAKPETEHLTVAVDCTIDHFNSSKVHNLLQSFEKEIKEGKLNFVFFRSGQKFDMLGMDNYYGSPFYIVNNRSAYWDSFKILTENKCHKTDSLSLQWFCLSNRYAGDLLDCYRRQIFNNTREILDNVPDTLKPHANNIKRGVRVNTEGRQMDPCFIDIKVSGKFHKQRSAILLGLFYKKCLEKGVKTHTRASFGFYHANCIIITINAIKGSSTIRINPGLNPEENPVIIDYLKELQI